MPLQIKVQGESTVSHMADMVEIDIAFKSISFYRNEASTTLFKAVEQVIDTLKTLSPTLDHHASTFQACPGGSITVWSIGTQHVQSQTTQISQTKAHQTTHTATTSLKVVIQDFQVLEQISKAITRTPCVSRVKMSWSLTSPVATRLKTEVHELAAKDALNKASAIASSIGFQTVLAEEVVLQAPQQKSLNTSNHFSDGDTTRQMPYVPRHGCLVGNFSYDHEYSSDYSDSKWTGRDESGNLDAWTLVLAPKVIALTAQVDARFSATSSTGWVYEELDQHRFITR
ncbi:hypothetical protein KCU77_g2444, partial [Aureobasidium melanogenum]